jgi:hypothetical protein
MGTRSRIGIEGEDGTVTSVYCHWDGYPEGVGAELLAHYNSAERAVELMKHGDLSSINGPDFAPEGAHGGGTVAYSRWRNDDCPPRVDASRDAYYGPDDWDIEYLYLYGPRGWEVSSGGNPPVWEPLVPAMVAA